MIVQLMLFAFILMACVLASRFSNKVGMPALLLFMGLGMLFGSDGLFRIEFENYVITEQICSTALIFIMFYGGFCTKWEIAKPVAGRAAVLSTVGVAATALLICLFCYFILKLSLIESYLLGAVVSSTDAASVFSILRSKKLSLKDGSASLLELESGSNDPMAYMLTVTGLLLLQGGNADTIGKIIYAQLFYGVMIGAAVAFGAILLIKKLKLNQEGLDTIFIVAAAVAAYSIPAFIGGNGYLSVYITGIILGNSKIGNKVNLVHFFDGITGLAQISIFFLLGLLSNPRQLFSAAYVALLIFLFLALVARPVAVFALLAPFKCSIRQCLLVSWAGLRGASSIVFAIVVIASGVPLEQDIYHIIFLISLMSVAIQGTLLPYAAKKLSMVDDTTDVSKTFNDYQDESALTLMRFYIPPEHPWENKMLKEIELPEGSLALMIKRDHDTLVPKGDSLILAQDSLILSVPSYQSEGEFELEEITISHQHAWCNQTIEELKLPGNILIALIKRGAENLIPQGATIILEGDIVVIYK